MWMWRVKIELERCRMAIRDRLRRARMPTVALAWHTHAN